MNERPLDRPDVDADRPVIDPAIWDEPDDLEEDEVPTVVLYIVAGLLLVAFTVYLVLGGGHNQFH